MKQLSREHQAILDLKTSFSSLRPIVEDEQSLELIRFYDSFEGAVSSFVLTELHIRQADRCKALGVFPDRQKFSLAVGEKHNLRGISYLGISRTFLQEFRKALKPENPVDRGFSRRIGEFKLDIKEALAELEIKGSDAGELGNVIDEVAAILKSGATSVDVFNYIDRKVGDLEVARKSPTRGADTNIAVWKLVSAAVMLALATWVVYKCYYSSWRCSKNEKAIYNSILAIASIIFGACE